MATEHGHLMRVAMMLQRVVAGPAISVHEAVRCDGVLNKRRQAGPGGVEETAQPDAGQSAALDFHRNDNQRLGFRLPPAPARVHAPHIGLVHFDPAGEAIAARTHHRPTKLVEPRPGGLVAAQTQRPLQPQGAHPRLLWFVTHHIARNHVTNGVRVSWKIVPAVTDVWWAQAAHCHHRRRTGHAFGAPQRGHRNPSWRSVGFDNHPDGK